MPADFEKRDLIKKSENFSAWYTDVILKAELADYAPTRGCMVFRPYGFAIWKNVQKYLGQMIEGAGVEDAYFPLFIPHSFLEKEKEHVKGFSPQLAVVTHGGGKKLSEPLVVRPTSETIIYEMYKKWISSWRDLPLATNQWVNIVRWEKRTYLFLRTLEFLWQEGHTCHATHKEAVEEVMRAIKMYKAFYQDFLAVPGFVGQKSEAEKFPGALNTFSYESLMPDGKALQGCTSHDLGQNFAKVFGIEFNDKNGESKYVWQTSWGFATRAIGSLIMIHGDDSGLVLPPKIAPIQVVIIPISEKSKNNEVLKHSHQVKQELEEIGLSAHLDGRDQYRPGWKFNEWELKGVPLRVEIGEREIKDGLITLARRDTGEKIKIKRKELAGQVQELLEKIQKNLYQKADKFLKQNTHQVGSYQEFKEIMKGEKGFIKAPWCGNPDCEAKIKQETKATVRVLSSASLKTKKKCIYCGKKAANEWLFAQSY